MKSNNSGNKKDPTRDFRFIPITDEISIPVPKDCSPEEAAKYIAQFKEKNDLDELRREYKQLAKEIEEDNWVSEERLHELLGDLIQEPQYTKPSP